MDELNVSIDKFNKQKNKANIIIPNQQGLIRITMVLLSSAILVRYTKLYPRFGFKNNSFGACVHMIFEPIGEFQVRVSGLVIFIRPVAPVKVDRLERWSQTLQHVQHDFISHSIDNIIVLRHSRRGRLFSIITAFVMRR